MKETPYFSFKPADIVALHLKKTDIITGDDDSEVLHLWSWMYAFNIYIFA